MILNLLKSFFLAEILESFDNHPPLILPNNTFHLEVGKSITEPAFLSHLKSLQEFIHSLPINQIQNELQPLQVPLIPTLLAFSHLCFGFRHDLWLYLLTVMSVLFTFICFN